MSCLVLKASHLSGSTMNHDVPFYARGEEERGHDFGSIRGYKGHHQSCFVRTRIILRMRGERERECVTQVHRMLQEEWSYLCNICWHG